MIISIILNLFLIGLGFHLGRTYTNKEWNDLIKSDSMLKDTFKLYQEGKLDLKNGNSDPVSSIEVPEKMKADPVKSDERQEEDFINYRDF